MTPADTLERLSPAEPAYVARVRLRAQRRVLWLRTLWAGEHFEAARELAITDDEVDRILNAPAEHLSAESNFYERDPVARDLGEQIRRADEDASADASWSRLRQAFGLSGAEVDMLSAALAVELSPQMSRVFGYLNDDANMTYATPALVAGLFGRAAEGSFGPRSRLVRLHLAYPQPGSANPWSVSAPWVADPFVAFHVVHGVALDPALVPAVEKVSVRECAEKACLYPEQLGNAFEFASAMRKGGASDAGSGPRVEVELVGPQGSGRRTLAGQLCAMLGVEMVSADAGALAGLEPRAAAEQVVRASRLARLEGAALFWSNADAAGQTLSESSEELCELTLFGTEAPMQKVRREGVARKTFRLPTLTRGSRLVLWSRLTREPAPPPVADWVLTPAEIVSAAQFTPAGPEAVADALRHSLRQSSGELFSPLVTPYTWDDIVLPAPLRAHLEELEKQARLRWPVYEEWGFERLCPMGRGITALFAGPSGTGKTMAAQVLARSLGMELYRVDLAGVVNKYIGETEKRLKQVFDVCERANVLLFFDEADALFGQRTQVKDAHDRFANIEIDYLLQRMEQFDGIAVLATNRKADLDKAFLRRLRFIVDFILPSPAERLAIWHHALPERAPDGQKLLDRIDWDFLAAKLDLTGADIKAAALGAAFLARSEGKLIGMSHLMHAARREVAKHGVVLRHGDWEE